MVSRARLSLLVSLFASLACAPPLEVVDLGTALELETDSEPPLGKAIPGAQVEVAAVLAASWLAAHSDEEDDRIFLRFHVQVKNIGDVDLHVHEAVADTDTTPLLTLDLDEDDLVIEAGMSEVYKVEIEAPQPMPTLAGIRFVFEEDLFPAIYSWPVVAYENATWNGGYRFPARAEDLAQGVYWSQGIHKHKRSQSYALDLGLKRWREEDGEWTGYTEQAYEDGANGIPLGSINEHYLVWGMPVYAMRAGLIIKCRRRQPDNVPGETQSGSNQLLVDQGNGEFASYVHFKQDSIPPELCPTEIWRQERLDPPIPVAAGDFLGLAGNSGPSSNPHLHLAISDRAHDAHGTRQSLPINFHDVEVHGFEGYDPTDDDAPGWNFVSSDAPAGMGHQQLLLPNPDGWKPSRGSDAVRDPVLGVEPRNPSDLDFGPLPRHVADLSAKIDRAFRNVKATSGGLGHHERDAARGVVP